MKYVVGNWKCNPSNLDRTQEILNFVNKEVENNQKTKVVVCPPFVYISEASVNFNLEIGAQNCFWKKEGSYTGEISVSMLKDLHCKYVIIGHSERRKLFDEKEEIIKKKVKICLEVGLTPILCVDKISQIFEEINKKVIIAYEPLSAIGSGEPVDWKEAKEMNLEIKDVLNSDQVVLYGGSVNSRNVLDFVEKAQFNGVLVGGNSLKPQEFVKIIKKVDEI
jgi:triosephosphate isomerase